MSYGLVPAQQVSIHSSLGVVRCTFPVILPHTDIRRSTYPHSAKERHDGLSKLPERNYPGLVLLHMV